MKPHWLRDLIESVTLPSDRSVRALPKLAKPLYEDDHVEVTRAMPDWNNPAELRVLVYRYVKARRTQLTSGEIALALGCTPEMAAGALRYLYLEGYVDRVERKGDRTHRLRWCLAPPGRKKRTPEEIRRILGGAQPLRRTA